MITEITYATRKSQLALAQSRAFIERLSSIVPGLRIVELQVVTSGDQIQDRPLTELGGKGLFVKEIEQALVEHRADIAIHSIKDVPAELAPGLCLACIPERASALDGWVSRSGQSLEQLPPGSVVGTSSLRRRLMLSLVREDLRFTMLRGNVDTRIRKVREGQVDATVLACAGLQRLGRIDEVTHPLQPEVCLPAVGQGALGIECREDDTATRSLLAQLDHAETSFAVAAERGVMLAVEGSCKVPVAAYAMRASDGAMWLRAALGSEDLLHRCAGERRVAWPSSTDDARAIGIELGRELREKLDVIRKEF